MVKRVLALDVGDKRIGVAVSDLLGITAQGVETIFTKGIERDLARVEELLKYYDTDRILIGDPKRLSGEEGAQAQKSRAFADRLTEMGYEVRFQDERLTSVSAERVLIDAGIRREDRKKVIDKLAATYILQSFMDAGGWDRIEPAIESGEREVFRLMEGYNMEQDNIVQLVDEEGNEVDFQHLMTFEMDGKTYVVLAVVEPSEEFGEDEAIVLTIEQDEEGNDVYASIEDDAELEKAFNRYLEIAENDEEE
ncbi:MAG: Holliday junction resolvase RuvX [Clostridia bacterium]|nr:Holliday junction resolvase RuvX [Clostridia bacterium]